MTAVKVVLIAFRPQDQAGTTWHKVLSEIQARYGEVLSFDAIEVEPLQAP